MEKKKILIFRGISLLFIFHVSFKRFNKKDSIWDESIWPNFLVRFNDQNGIEQSASDLAEDRERTRRCKLQYALALRMWQFEWAKIARLGQRPFVIGGTRSRVCVRSFASMPSHEIRTGGQDDGRWDALGNRRWHSLTHSPTYPTSLPSYSTLYRFSFIHKKFRPYFSFLF